MENFFDYSISGLDVKAYVLFRKGYMSGVAGYTNQQVTGPNRQVVRLDCDWVAYEIGMLRLLQFSLQSDVKEINTMTATNAKGLALGRSIVNGRAVFRNTAVDTLSDLKNRILTNDKYKIEILSETFGIDFEEEVTEANIDEAMPMEPKEVGWEQMPPFDILLVASDERQIELPRVCRIKDVKMGSSGSSEGATDTEDNEFCNFMALSGYTPWRTLK